MNPGLLGARTIAPTVLLARMRPWLITPTLLNCPAPSTVTAVKADGQRPASVDHGVGLIGEDKSPVPAHSTAALLVFRIVPSPVLVRVNVPLLVSLPTV